MTGLIFVENHDNAFGGVRCKISPTYPQVIHIVKFELSTGKSVLFLDNQTGFDTHFDTRYIAHYLIYITFQ